MPSKKLQNITVPKQTHRMMVDLSNTIREIDNQIDLTATTLKDAFNVNGDYSLSPDASSLISQADDETLAIPQSTKERILEMAKRQGALRERMEVIVATLLDAYDVSNTHELSQDGAFLVPLEKEQENVELK